MRLAERLHEILQEDKTNRRQVSPLSRPSGCEPAISSSIARQATPSCRILSVSILTELGQIRQLYMLEDLTSYAARMFPFVLCANRPRVSSFSAIEIFSTPLSLD